MIDAHILIGNEPAAWRDQALSDIAALPITLYTCQAIEGQPAEARKIGWQQGTNDLVTWFDPDDCYPIEAAKAFIEESLKIFKHHPRIACIYSSEQRVDEYLNPIEKPDIRPYSRAMSITHPAWVHGIIIIRRHVLMQHIHPVGDHAPYAEHQLVRSMSYANHGFIRLPHVARLWRQHDNQLHKRTKTTS